MTVKVSAVARLDHARPLLEVLQFRALVLREQVVGDAYRQLLFLRQFLDHRVVFRIILEAAARVDGAGQAQAIEFAHELARGIDLQFARQGWTLGQGRI
ncbi:hypothetical protein D3C71_1786380 [compost metagenome]